MTDTQILEAAKAFVDANGEGYFNTETTIKTFTETGMNIKQASTAAWVVMSFCGQGWSGVTKSNTFSHNREDREYLVSQLRKMY